VRFAGVLPEDAPDPRLATAEALKAMPVPVIEFTQQPALEITDTGIASVTNGADYSAMTTSVSARLWRNPEDRSDPVNLAEIDEKTRRSIDEVPPWPRPAWLLELVELMRYPILWEAVHTTWHRDETEYTTLEYLLVHHANHILMNQFRGELQLIQDDWDSPSLTSERSVRHGVPVVVDGMTLQGAEIDTDPFVYAIGSKLSGGGTLTAVISREYLPYIDLSFASRR
jgi:hypothetical protein